MIAAAFLTQHESWPWRRQLPAGRICVEGVEFFAPTQSAEVVFIYDALPSASADIPARALRIFVCSEPENVKRYNADFLAQFDVIITADRRTPHPSRIFVQAGLPWHVGSMRDGGVLVAEPMRFEDFERHDPPKSNLVSVVSSDKSFTAEHRARLDFVSKLKYALGDQIDIFGRGIVDFADKRDVLDSYRYHIAIENCSINDFWTEKLADPFLTMTFPIYHGCPNILEYFPAEALAQINIHNPDEAIATIKNIIGSDLAEQRRAALLEARRRVMHEHNVFVMLARIGKRSMCLRTGARAASEHQVTIRAEAAFAPAPRRWRAKAIRTLAAIPHVRTPIRALKRLLGKSSQTTKG